MSFQPLQNKHNNKNEINFPPYLALSGISSMLDYFLNAETQTDSIPISPLLQEEVKCKTHIETASNRAKIKQRGKLNPAK
jgi:hypothetical protein